MNAAVLSVTRRTGRYERQHAREGLERDCEPSAEPHAVIGPTNRIRMQTVIAVDGAEPGAYEFELNLKDELSGKIMDYKEDMTITAKPDVVVAPLTR